MSSQKAKQFLFLSEEEMYTIQTQNMFLSVQFSSPIKQICEYLQQYEKYALKSILYSINLKVHEEEALYIHIRETIKKQQQHYMQKTMKYVEDMIMNVQFMKIQNWHYYSQIIKGYQSEVLGKDIDCYEFNVDQFHSDYEKVLKYLKQYKAINKENAPRVKSEIKSLQRVIQETQKKKLSSMFMKNPFKSQNIHGKEVNSSKLFPSYFREVEYESDCYVSSFQRKHFAIEESILKFYDALLQFSLKIQKKAHSIIHTYNSKNHLSDANSIVKSKFELHNRQIVDANDINMEWNNQEYIRPSLVNRREKLTFSDTVLIRDEEKGIDENAILVSNNKQRGYDAGAKMFLAYHPYQHEISQFYDPYIHDYTRNKLRNNSLAMDEYRKRQYEQRYLESVEEFKQRQFESKKKSSNLIQKDCKPSRITDDQCHYASVIMQRREQQIVIWKLDKKEKTEGRYLFQVPKQTAKEKFYKTLPYYLSQSQKKKYDNRFENLIREETQMKEQKGRKYQQQKRKQEERRMIAKKKLLERRNYRKFAEIMKLSKQTWINDEIIERYGMRINLNTNKNDENLLEEFLFYTIKQKYFRQNQSIDQKQKIPILLKSAKPEQFFNSKTVNQLVKKTKQKFFILWSCDIIIYEEIKTPQKTSSGVLKIYSYVNLKKSRSFFSEFRKKVDFNLVGEVFSFKQEKKGKGQILTKSLSKLQVIHRQLYKLHLPIEDLADSIQKGHIIYSRILKNLSDQIVAQQRSEV